MKQKRPTGNTNVWATQSKVLLQQTTLPVFLYAALCNYVQTDQTQHIWSSSENTDLTKNDSLVMEVSFLVVRKQSTNIQCVQRGIAVYQPPQLFFTDLVPAGQTDGILLAGMTYKKKWTAHLKKTKWQNTYDIVDHCWPLYNRR